MSGWTRIIFGLFEVATRNTNTRNDTHTMAPGVLLQDTLTSVTAPDAGWIPVGQLSYLNILVKYMVADLRNIAFVLRRKRERVFSSIIRG